MRPRAQNPIERAIQGQDWEEARKLIKARLLIEPKDHWLLARLALTFYEQKQYHQALLVDKKALREAPYCPLVIWGYAGTLDMLGREDEARLLYKWLMSWGEEDLAFGPCGEGLRWARALIADCHYRTAMIWEAKGQRKRALASWAEYISKRTQGHWSIYSLRIAKLHQKSLMEWRRPSKLRSSPSDRKTLNLASVERE